MAHVLGLKVKECKINICYLLYKFDVCRYVLVRVDRQSALLKHFLPLSLCHSDMPLRQSSRVYF